MSECYQSGRSHAFATTFFLDMADQKVPQIFLEVFGPASAKKCRDYSEEQNVPPVFVVM